MNRLVCEHCGTVYYSAAARIMVEQGERCDNCGGKLVLANGPRAVPDPPAPGHGLSGGATG